MKKSIMAVFMALILATSLAGCGEKSPQDTYKEVYKRYNDLKSFYAAATVRVKSASGEGEYAVRQFYKAPDSYAFFVDAPEAVAGSGYVAKDGGFTLKSGTGDRFESEVAFPDSKNCMFICDFFEEYYKSEETALTVSEGLMAEKLVMQCYLSGKDKNRFMQSLTIDTKTYLPITLTTYDIDKKPVIEVEFHDFKRNSPIDEKIFN